MNTLSAAHVSNSQLNIQSGVRFDGEDESK